MKICALNFTAKLLPTNPAFGSVDTIVRCNAFLALASDSAQMLNQVNKLLADSHLVLHKMENFAFLDKPYPSGDPEMDRILESVQGHGRHLWTERMPLEPEKN